MYHFKFVYFLKDAMPNKKLCRQDHAGAEDVEIGKCLANVNVLAGDSRDPEARGRFFPFSPTHHLIPGHVDKSFWYWSYIFYNETQVGILISIVTSDK